MSITFGSYLRNLRTQKHLSQRGLAAQVGIDFTYLSKIERGQSTPPRESVIRHLARALDTNEDELINHAGKIPPHLKISLRDNPTLSELLRVLSEQRLPDEVYRKMLVLIEEQPLYDNTTTTHKEGR